jgi:hypothetical protein
MRDSIPEPKGLWLKTRFANLVRYVPSGIYFSRIRVRGKLIRRSLKTNKLAVARLRLAGLEKVERQGAIVNGNMTFAGGVAYRTLPVQNLSSFQMVRARGLEPSWALSRIFTNVRIMHINIGDYSLFDFSAHERLPTQNETFLSGIVRNFLCRNAQSATPHPPLF